MLARAELVGAAVRIQRFGFLPVETKYPNVNLTALRMFGPGEINARVLTASICRPTMFEAVQIDEVKVYQATEAFEAAQPCYNRLLTPLPPDSHGSNEYPNAHGPI